MARALSLAGSTTARLRAWCWGHAAGASSRTVAVLLVAGASAGALGLLGHLDARSREIAALEDQVQAAERQLQAVTRAAPSAVLESVPLSEWQWRRYGEAIAQLNAPWPAIFDVMERVGVNQAVPIGIEPDIQAGRARLVIEARTLPQAYAYLGQLSRDPGVQRVQLIRHEVVVPAANAGGAGMRPAPTGLQAGPAVVRMTADVFWRSAALGQKGPA